jgi:hypothetical protein
MMFADVFDLFFGCWHKNYSFPITSKKGSPPKCRAARVTGTYVVCLDCGKEFPYDWEQMKVVSANSGRSGAAPLTPEPVSGLKAA